MLGDLSYTSVRDIADVLDAATQLATATGSYSYCWGDSTHFFEWEGVIGLKPDPKVKVDAYHVLDIGQSLAWCGLLSTLRGISFSGIACAATVAAFLRHAKWLRPTRSPELKTLVLPLPWSGESGEIVQAFVEALEVGQLTQVGPVVQGLLLARVCGGGEGGRCSWAWPGWARGRCRCIHAI